jgi:hypothetical protein
MPQVGIIQAPADVAPIFAPMREADQNRVEVLSPQFGSAGCAFDNQVKALLFMKFNKFNFCHKIVFFSSLCLPQRAGDCRLLLLLGICDATLLLFRSAVPTLASLVLASDVESSGSLK